MFPLSKTQSGKSRPGSKDTRRRHPPCVRVRFISAANWWLRSPYCNSNNGATNALNVNTNGNWSNNNCSNAGYAIRPALMENEISKRGDPPKTVYHLSKGIAHLSKACAWADDEYIIPRRTAPQGAQSATEGKRTGIRRRAGWGFLGTNPARGSEGNRFDL